MDIVEKGSASHEPDMLKGTAHDAAEKGHVATDQYLHFSPRCMHFGLII